MKINSSSLGRWGEELAASYLTERGYKILENNFRCGRQEVDLIASFNKTLVFVEVKTRSSFSFGSASEAVDSRKINNLKKALAKSWFGGNFDGYDDFRLDLVAIDVDLKSKKAKVSHFKDII